MNTTGTCVLIVLAAAILLLVPGTAADNGSVTAVVAQRIPVPAALPLELTVMPPAAKGNTVPVVALPGRNCRDAESKGNARR